MRRFFGPGSALVGLAILVMLVLLWRSTRRRPAIEPAAEAAGQPRTPPVCMQGDA
jgi:hypothetical protein